MSLAGRYTKVAVIPVVVTIALANGPTARGQAIPGLGGAAGGLGAPIAAPIGGTAAGVATSALGTVAPQPTIWGFLGLSKSNLAACHVSLQACREKLCATPIGQVLNGVSAPIGAVSGGLVPPFCPPTPSPAQLAAAEAAGGAQGVAAAIKAEEAKAAAKIAALQYLATVDCGVWPEAEKAMIDALRLDRNECVRFAAARALAGGCCCTDKTAAALTNVLEGETTDGGILERSERVKSACAVALMHCVNRYIPRPKRRPEAPPAPRRPELPALLPGDGLPGDAALASYLHGFYEAQAARPDESIIAEARAALRRMSESEVALGVASLPTGSRSVYHALVKANHNPSVPATRGAPGAAAPVLTLRHDAPPPTPVVALDQTVARAAVAAAPPIPSSLPVDRPVPPPPPIPGDFPGTGEPASSAPPALAEPLPPLPATSVPAPAPTPSVPTPALPQLNAPSRSGVPPTGQRSLLQIFSASRRPRRS